MDPTVNAERAFLDLRLTVDSRVDPPTAILSEVASGHELASDQCHSLDYDYLASEFLEPLGQGAGISLERLLLLGRELAGAAFPLKVQRALSIQAGSHPIRLRVRLADRCHCDLPWEYSVVDYDNLGPLALAANIHLVRDAAGEPFLYHGDRDTFRVLVAIADPRTRNHPALEKGHTELYSIEKAIGAPECRRFAVEVLRYATPSALVRSLVDRPPDVLHFIGHAGVRPSGGFLVLESHQSNTECFVYASELGPLLQEAGTRLIVLSGCLTNGCANSIGTELSGMGVPAVLGMQLPISDRSAHLFSRAMYASLAEGAFLEEAVQQGRSAIAGAGSDWGAPVLTLAANGISFRTDTRHRPAPSLRSSRHNIPFEDRPFVGRTAESDALKRVVQDRRLRITTVTGMGGMGKTRLGRQVAVELAANFSDGAWLISCEVHSGRAELIAATAAALQLDSNCITEADLISTLRDMDVLLLIDCFEHLIVHADLLSHIVSATERVQMLVTSRILLGIPEEREFVLPPMALKRRKGQPSEGIELFLQAARYAVPTVVEGREAKRLVASLVQDLEAIPLAIVLAAGRLRYMSLAELSARVRTHRLDTLRRRPTDAADKHADLLRVVGDSFAILFDDDRALAKSLSVFRGGFYFEDARAVLPDAPDLLDGIALLRDHSLLSSQVLSGRMRFRSLDTILEYIDRITPPGELDGVRRRHAIHFVGHARAIRRQLEDGHWVEANDSLWIDIGNYRAANRYAIEGGDPVLICQMAEALARPYFEAGLQADFLGIVNVAELHARHREDLPLIIELKGLKGAFFRRNEQPELAKNSWLDRARLCGQAGDHDNEAESLLDVADLALATGDYDTVEEMFGRFDVLGIEHPKTVATRLLIEAREQLAKGSSEKALALAARAEKVGQLVEEGRQALYVWLSLAVVYRASASYGRCEQVSRYAIEEALKRGYAQSAGKALLELAKVLEITERLTDAALALAVASQIPRNVSSALREECKERQRQFTDKHGRELLEPALERARRTNWSVLAAEIASR